MSSLSRREFLRDSAIFAAAAGVLGEARADIKKAEAGGNNATPEKVAANDRIRVACIGFHGQGRTHLNSFSKSPDSVITTICDVDSNLAASGIKTVEQNQGQPPKFVQDLRRIMDDKEIDVVSIATPNHWHALAAIWAIQAGKDVYLEKPVSHNVSEGRRIVDFARKHNKIVQTGTQSRSNTGMREMLDFIHEGKVGKITLARGLCYKDRRSIGAKTETPVPSGVDYDLWLGPAPLKPITRKQFHYDWHWFWDYGNGDLGNQGIHEMDKARWGLKKPQLPLSVMSLGGRFGYVDAGETANTQICIFDYGDSQLIFEVRGLSTPGVLGAKVGNIWYGPDGYVVSTNYYSGAAFTPKGELIKKFEGQASHYANFLKAVKSRKYTDLNADIEEGHLSSALCHLGNVSYRLGQTRRPAEAAKELNKDGQESFTRMIDHLRENKVEVENLPLAVGRLLKIDPKAEVFIGDAEANKLLTRDYRKGFEVPAKA